MAILFSGNWLASQNFFGTIKGAFTIEADKLWAASLFTTAAPQNYGTFLPSFRAPFGSNISQKISFIVTQYLEYFWARPLPFFPTILDSKGSAGSVIILGYTSRKEGYLLFPPLPLPKKQKNLPFLGESIGVCVSFCYKKKQKSIKKGKIQKEKEAPLLDK